MIGWVITGEVPRGRLKNDWGIGEELVRNWWGIGEELVRRGWWEYVRMFDKDLECLECLGRIENDLRMIWEICKENVWRYIWEWSVRICEILRKSWIMPRECMRMIWRLEKIWRMIEWWKIWRMSVNLIRMSVNVWWI